MRRNRIIAILLLLNILVISFFIIRYTTETYPKVGFDYTLFTSRLLDSLLHYRVNGFSIQWYTPSFGGGLPAYANPLQMQFSLPQLLTFFTDPFKAILASAVIYLAIGSIVAYLLAADVLKLQPFSAILAAVFFVISGFFIDRVVVGHADKISYPLIVIPIYALLNRKLPAWLSGGLIGLTMALFFYSGGEYIAVMALFAAMLTLPLLYLVQPGWFSWRKGFAVAGWGILFSVLLCGSKLYPLLLLLQNFPRTVTDHYFVPWYSSIAGSVMQLVGVMTAEPLLRLLGKSSLDWVVRLQNWTGSPYGFWEVDSSISPALFILLVYGIIIVLKRKPRLDLKTIRSKAVAGMLLLLAVVVVVEFSITKGIFFDFLNKLPVFQSLRTNTRFIASFTLPLALLGGLAFDRMIKSISSRRGVLLFAAFEILTLASLWAYFLLPPELYVRAFDVRVILSTYQDIRRGATFPVNKVVPDMHDYEVFRGQATNVAGHYDPLYAGHSFTPDVHEGSVFQVTDGYFNMSDPTGYVFPALNGSDLFSRIPVSQADKLNEFLNRKQPDWKIPPLQIFLDWVAGLTFLFLIFGPILYFTGRKDRLARFLPFPRLKIS